MRKQKKEDEKLVKARYYNHEYKENGRLYKPYVKYAGDPIRIYNLIHDHTYELPLGFIEEVNAVTIPVREGLQEVDGKSVTNDGSPLNKDSVRREHELVPTSFR